MKDIVKELRIAIIATILLAILVCVIYPVAVWVLGQGLFPYKANGSLVTVQGKLIGSSLLAQGFSGERYFHPRPSAAGSGYDAVRSGGTNWGPTSKRLIDAVRDHCAAYRAENNLPPGAPVPADAVTASASGLDPHVSVRNALLQAGRVARSRGLPVETVIQKIKAHTERRTFGILGEPRVNVLMLNCDMDGIL